LFSPKVSGGISRIDGTYMKAEGAKQADMIEENAPLNVACSTAKVGVRMGLGLAATESMAL
jgi:hypothetical protein